MEREKITAKEFYEAFVGALKAEEALGQYKSSPEWTAVLSRVINEKVLSKIFDLKTNKEYFRIDSIGWKGHPDWTGGKDSFKKYDKTSSLQLNEYYWNLEVAVEYENNYRDWTNEFIKLCHVKCGLKVVIGYAPHDQRGKDMEKLELIAGHMRNLKYGRLGKDEQFLVILGNCKKEVYESFEDIDFRAYVYDGEKFKRLVL